MSLRQRVFDILNEHGDIGQGGVANILHDQGLNANYTSIGVYCCTWRRNNKHPKSVVRGLRVANQVMKPHENTLMKLDYFMGIDTSIIHQFRELASKFDSLVEFEEFARKAAEYRSAA